MAGHGSKYRACQHDVTQLLTLDTRHNKHTWVRRFAPGETSDLPLTCTSVSLNNKIKVPHKLDILLRQENRQNQSARVATQHIKRKKMNKNMQLRCG